MPLNVQPAVITPNWIDYAPTGFLLAEDTGDNRLVRLSGGAWGAGAFQPITNLRSPYLFDMAYNTDSDEAFFHADLGRLREVGGLGVIMTGDRGAKVRLRASSQVNWIGVTVNGTPAANATTISVNTGVNGLVAKKGDGFTINGNLYQINADVTIGASTSGNITLKRIGENGAGIRAGDNVNNRGLVCIAGNFATETIYDSGWLDRLPVIYESGSLPADSQAFTDLKPTDEDLNYTRCPFSHWLVTPVTARYWRVDFDNNGNIYQDIYLNRVYLGPAVKPTRGASYSSSTNIFTDAVPKKSKGGARRVTEETIAAQATLVLVDTPTAEATNIKRALARLGLAGQCFFTFNCNDPKANYGEAFPAYVERLDTPFVKARYDSENTSITFTEVIA